MQQGYVTLAHGAGGRQSARLIHDVFRGYLDNPHFTADDAAAAVGIVDLQHRSLRDRVRRATIQRMRRVAFDLDRPAVVAGDE